MIKEEVLKLCNDGVSAIDISSKLGCNRAYVYRIIKEVGCKSAKQIEIDKCIDMLTNTNKSFYVISKELNMPEGRVRSIAYKYDLREKKKSFWGNQSTIHY